MKRHVQTRFLYYQTGHDMLMQTVFTGAASSARPRRGLTSIILPLYLVICICVLDPCIAGCVDEGGREEPSPRRPKVISYLFHVIQFDVNLITPANLLTVLSATRPSQERDAALE